MISCEKSLVFQLIYSSADPIKVVESRSQAELIDFYSFENIIPLLSKATKFQNSFPGGGSNQWNLDDKDTALSATPWRLANVKSGEIMIGLHRITFLHYEVYWKYRYRV